ncbi:hypothetical protein ACFOOM_01175 [Streptomyces echinoruber]|uniref:Uncharacterized protein n=1 Tax=Streptomyces echinoruber TaxID=68898 RepID=A0A918V5H7_9ACTN|nr:hypothetical protein [Streptomyces echinoruber]GGZ72981.1 hypothetical protein GCM10010389_07980 [Streptomyces echinoruber]
MTAADAAVHDDPAPAAPAAQQTRRRISVTLTLASDRPASLVGAAVTAAVGDALPDELIGVSWHAFTLPAPDDQQQEA